MNTQSNQDVKLSGNKLSETLKETCTVDLDEIKINETIISLEKFNKKYNSLF